MRVLIRCVLCDVIILHTRSFFFFFSLQAFADQKYIHILMAVMHIYVVISFFSFFHRSQPTILFQFLDNFKCGPCKAELNDPIPPFSAIVVLTVIQVMYLKS